MTDEQMRMIKEIGDNKDVYISLITDEDKKNQVINLYDKYSKEVNIYLKSLVFEISSRVSYDSALKSHKIDPYVAGGIADGLAGRGAGLYTALATKDRNEKIEADRYLYKQEVARRSITTSSDERNLLDTCEKISRILETIPEIKKYKDEKNENLYEKACNLMRESDTFKRKGLIEAKKIFSTLGEYKQSAVLLNQCEKQLVRSRKALVYGWSVGIAICVFVILLAVDVEEAGMSLLRAGGISVAFGWLINYQIETNDKQHEKKL